MAGLKILVIGSGGREHAISPGALHSKVIRFFVRLGIRGLRRLLRISNDRAILISQWSGRRRLWLAGWSISFGHAGLAIVGPTQQAAQLEASKIHSKEFMRRVGIPTARFVRVETVGEGLAALDQFEYPIVVKCDGLAAGKGVIIAQNRKEAEAAVIFAWGRGW